MGKNPTTYDDLQSTNHFGWPGLETIVLLKDSDVFVELLVWDMLISLHGMIKTLIAV